MFNDLQYNLVPLL